MISAALHLIPGHVDMGYELIGLRRAVKGHPLRTAFMKSRPPFRNMNYTCWCKDSFIPVPAVSMEARCRVPCLRETGTLF